MTLQEIGIFIKRRRESLRLKQEDMAELSDVATKTIHLIEQGTGNPRFDTLTKLADLLGLELTITVKSVGQ